MHLVISFGLVDLTGKLKSFLPTTQFKLLTLEDKNGSIQLRLAKRIHSYNDIKYIIETIPTADRQKLLMVQDVKGDTPNAFCQVVGF